MRIASLRERTSRRPLHCVAIAVLFSLYASIDAVAAPYGLKQTEPDTGTSIRRVIGSTSIPLDRGYADLNASELADLRAQIPALGPTDEPPFPESLRPLREHLSRIQHKRSFRAQLSLLVRVGADGSPLRLEVLDSSDDDIRDLVSKALMSARYKAAKCAGSACEMDLPFSLELSSGAFRQ